jgi:hypothetical protein
VMKRFKTYFHALAHRASNLNALFVRIIENRLKTIVVSAGDSRLLSQVTVSNLPSLRYIVEERCNRQDPRPDCSRYSEFTDPELRTTKIPVRRLSKARDSERTTLLCQGELK